MKRFYCILIILFSFFSSCVSVWGLNEKYSPPKTPPTTVAAAKADDNNFLGATYFKDFRSSKNKTDVNKLNIQFFDKGYHILFYGGPSDWVDKFKKYRYIGENSFGEKVLNLNYPPDVSPNGKFEDQQWIKDPAHSSQVINYLQKNNEKIQPSPWDNVPDFLPNIVQGLKIYHGTELNGKYVNWVNYVHVITPPTYYGWGMGRAWHNENGTILYRSFPIAPTGLIPPPPPPAPTTPKTPKTPDTGTGQQPTPTGKQNLKVVITGTGGDPWVGNKITAYAKVTNESGKLLTTDLTWKLNGKVISANAKFDVISQAVSTATFTMPSGTAKIEVVVNPNHTKPKSETTWADNTASKTLISKTLPAPSKNSFVVKISAPSQVEPNKSWTYNVKVTYNWTRPFGYTGPPPTEYVTLTTTANGKQTQGFDFNTGNISPKAVTRNQKDSFNLTGGGSKTLTYSFPGTAMINEGYYVTINSSLNKGASDAAKVYVKPLVMTKPGVVLDQ